MERQFAVIIAWAVLLGLVPGIIADRKGRSFLLWWFYGTAMLIVAFPCALFLKNKSGKKCPACAEYVAQEAILCKHCGTKFEALSGTAT